MDESAFIAHFAKAKRLGPGRYMVCCPAHDDGTPSLSLSVMPDGRKLAKCHGGCTFEQVREASGLPWEEWFPPDTALNARAYMPGGGPSRRERLNIETEYYIIAIAKRDLLRGNKLSPEDAARLKLAIERVRKFREPA